MKPYVASSTKYNTVAHQHHAVTLQCTFHADPLPDVYWSKNGLTIVSAGRMAPTKIVQNNNTLTIVKSLLTIAGTQIGDAGKYTCHAKNQNGTIQKELDLVVLCEFSLSISKYDDDHQFRECI